MTVKELIMEVKFDDLLPYLKEIIVASLLERNNSRAF